MHNFIRVSSTPVKSREIWWSNSKKGLRQMSGGKDGQTLFYRVLPTSARKLTSAIVVDWHSISVSLQKIGSIHKLIQQILGSHELNDHAHFWPGPPKNHWNNFLLSWICTTMQKISSFHQFILEIQPILGSCGQTGCTHFWPRPSKNFLINF